MIDAVGPGVERLAAGQSVMVAVAPYRPAGGAQAEQIVVPAASVVPIPDGLTPGQASTLPMNGLTARLGLEELGLSAGETLAVSGGAGLLASYVIAIAKDLGLRVVADAKEEDEDLVRSYGADVVVPRGGDFAAAVREVEPDGVDGLFDTAALNADAIGAVRDGGAMVSVLFWKPDEEPRDIEVKPIMVSTVLERTDWLEDLARLAGDGKLALRTPTTYPPERVAEAQRAMDAGGLRGRGVIVF